MRLFGSGKTKKNNDGGLSLMLKQRKFEVISQVVLQDPNTAKDLLSQAKVLFKFLEHDVPAELLSIVATVVPNAAFIEQDEKGRTPLHIAVQNKCSKEVISSLAVRKAAKAKDHNGRVPLHYAVSGKLNRDIVKTLLKVAPSAINEEDETGATPLELADKADSKTMDLLKDTSSALSTSLRRSASRSTLRDDSERTTGRCDAVGDLRRNSDLSGFDSASSLSSRGKGKRGSKDFNKSALSQEEFTKARSASHESLDKPHVPGKPCSSRSGSLDIPYLIESKAKASSLDDSLSTIGTVWEKPALPLTGVEFVELLAQRANS